MKPGDVVGLSYDDQFVGEFTLTRLTEPDTAYVERLQKGTLPGS